MSFSPFGPLHAVNFHTYIYKYWYMYLSEMLATVIYSEYIKVARLQVLAVLETPHNYSM